MGQPGLQSDTVSKRKKKVKYSIREQLLLFLARVNYAHASVGLRALPPLPPQGWGGSCGPPHLLSRHLIFEELPKNKLDGSGSLRSLLMLLQMAAWASRDSSCCSHSSHTVPNGGLTKSAQRKMEGQTHDRISMTGIQL